MEASFWQARWGAGQIGFHEGAPNRFLLRFGERLEPAGSVLVPMCGKSVDLDALAQRGLRVTGVEWVEQAVLDYFRERGEVPAKAHEGGLASYTRGDVTLLQGDFFAFAPAQPFDAIWDRAALIALPRAMRDRYAKELTRSIRPGGRMLLVTLEHDARDGENPSGPPFEVTPAEVHAHYDAAFDVEELAFEDVLSSSQNLVAKGATRVAERCWLLTRRAI